MGSQARSQGVDKGDAQEDGLEQLAAYIQRNFRQCCIRLFETLQRREEQLNKERYGDEDYPTIECGKEDSARDHTGRIRRFFTQRGNGIKTQKRKAQDGGAGNDRQ
ncbi:hypothetical protein D3C76_1076750 [compost metagenome]